MSSSISRDLVQRALEVRRTREGTPRPPELDPCRLIAAVAAILSPHEPVEILLIRRAQSERDPWSQHMAFPGGKLDAHDLSLRATANRETREELGLDLELGADYLGPLPALRSSVRGRTVEIKPFVYALKRPALLMPNHEVDQVVWVPLESLMNDSRNSKVVHEQAGQRVELPAWQVQGGPVWGLTYGIIQSLLTLLRNDA